LEHKVQSDSTNKVFITMSSGVCQAHTPIQAQCVLGFNHKYGRLGFKHSVYSELEHKGVIRLRYKHNVYLD
jgi:hypothetical protein